MAHIAILGAGTGGMPAAHEYSLILNTDLRRRMRHTVPITFVTSEPCVGHPGLGGRRGRSVYVGSVKAPERESEERS
jgi:hypothetical protein